MAEQEQEILEVSRRARVGANIADDFTVGRSVFFGPSAPERMRGTWTITGEWGRGGALILCRVGRRGSLLKPSARNRVDARAQMLVQWGAQVVFPNATPKRPEPTERAPEGAPTVRSFSTCGPCIPEGRLVRETAKMLVVETRNGPRVDVVRMRKGGRLHTAPCTRCTDHPRTAYPHGYMD